MEGLNGKPRRAGRQVVCGSRLCLLHHHMNHECCSLTIPRFWRRCVLLCLKFHLSPQNHTPKFSKSVLTSQQLSLGLGACLTQRLALPLLTACGPVPQQGTKINVQLSILFNLVAIRDGSFFNHEGSLAFWSEHASKAAPKAVNLSIYVWHDYL